MPIKSGSTLMILFLALLGFQSGCGGGSSASASTGVIAKYVAVGSGGVIYHSQDAVTWTAAASGTTVNLNDVVWNGSAFCAVGGTGTILHSANGKDWTPSVTLVPTTLNAITASGSGLLCAVGNVASGHSVVATSSDNGVTWTPHTLTATQNLNAVCWDGSYFCAVGDSGLTTTSIAGDVWTVPIFTPSPTKLLGITTLLEGGSLSRVVLEISGRIYQAYGYTDNWIERADFALPFMFWGIASSGSVAVVAGSENPAGGRIYSSSNPATWTPVWNDTVAGSGLNKVAWDGSRFIAVGLNGSVVVSTNASGASWTYHAVPTTTQALLGIASR
jgi:hypothetical protein